jgi:succinyl-diaminopimelate desuccinylase
MAADSPALNDVDRYVRNRGSEVLELAMRLVGVDTANPPGETADLVDLVEEWLPAAVRTERVVGDPAKPNLLARVPGDGDRALCLNGHLDTVPFDGHEWQHDPLGERVDDRLYGRGTTDMKGAVASMLLAVAAFAETDTTPPVPLELALVSDEETGGDAGLETLLDRESFDPAACVIGETTARNDRCSVTVADRGSIWLTLEATGVGAHGSRPMLGTNAIDRVYDAVASLRTMLADERLQLPAAVERIVDESVDFYAPEAGADAARDLFEFPTLNLGTLEGGTAVNSVPTTATAEVDIRVTAGVATERVLGRIRDCVHGHDAVTITDLSWSQGSYEPVDRSIVSATAESVRRVTDTRVHRRSATGGGDAKTLRHAGIPTVEFGFGTGSAHGPDEYITRQDILDNARVYAAVPFLLRRLWDGDGTENDTSVAEDTT